MPIRRREFLKFGLLQTAAVATVPTLAFPRRSHAFVARKKTPSILQGATDETKTQFSIVHNTADAFEVIATNSHGEMILPDVCKVIQRQGHSRMITKAYFSGLNPHEVFHLNLVSPTSRLIIEKREFQTLDLTKESLQFALCSCMDDSNHKPEIWNTLVAKRPDMIFFIGDSVYADHDAPTDDGADPDHLFRRFCEARSTLEIFYSQRLIPIFATWDDHDFGNNDTGNWYPWVKESQENFLNFFAQDESHCRFLSRGPGISSVLHAGSQLFLLLDDRSFREKKGSKDRYAHWGKEQEEWMIELLGKHQGPAWVMNGTQVVPEMIFKESVASDHKAQLKGLRGELKKISSRVVFISGDVHFSEISELEPALFGYKTYEVTSSSIHSTTFPGVPDLIENKRRLESTGKRNFVLIDAKATGLGAEFSATSVAANGSIRFKRNLQV